LIGCDADVRRDRFARQVQQQPAILLARHRGIQTHETHATAKRTKKKRLVSCFRVFVAVVVIAGWV
jgi:hypothetical protein